MLAAVWVSQSCSYTNDILFYEHPVGTSWSLVVLWHLMIVQLYYATGHQPTITGMKLGAGFVGLRGDVVGYKLVLAGFLVGLNTLVAQVTLTNDQQHAM